MNKIIFIGFILILASCAVGPKYKRPSTKTPEAYTQSAVRTDSITNMKWWEVYQDTVLQTLIEKAIGQNLDLKIAVARIEQTRAIHGFNKANMFPFLDYGARARFSDFRDVSNEAQVTFPSNSFSLLGNVSWEIDLWGKLRHANRAAYADLLASEEDRKSVYIIMVAKLLNYIFNFADWMNDWSSHKEQMRQEENTCASLPFDLKEVKYPNWTNSRQKISLRPQKRNCTALNVQLSRPKTRSMFCWGKPIRPLRGDCSTISNNYPLDIPTGLPSELLLRRPDIVSAEQLLIAQTERVGVAVALRFPSLSLTGFLGVASPDIGTLFEGDAFLGSITGQLAGPLFRLGQNKRRVEVEMAIAKQVGYEYEKTILNAFAEVENSLAEIRTFRNEFDARQMQVAATEKALMLSKALYDNGYTSFLQVLDAERELFSAQFEKSLALQFQLSSTVRLYKALGGGWETANR